VSTIFEVVKEICRKEREEKEEEWQLTVMIMEDRGYNNDE
jgi:hypothetical protein